MKEVMKWSKDYRTGEVVTEKAYKPENIKGRAFIQVFNGGEVVQEVETHNIIVPPSKYVTNGYYEKMYQSLMPSVNVSGGDQSYNPYGFAYMVLTDCADDENEETMAVRGNVVGWCPRVNETAGTDTSRGIYNPLESYIKYEDGYYHAHLVYDFGTSQGNGEFNSIWWTTLGRAADKSTACAPIRIAPISPAHRYSGALTKPSSFLLRLHDGTMVSGASGNYSAILNYKEWLNGIEPMQVSPDYIPNALNKVNGLTFTQNGVLKYGKIDNTSMPTADSWVANTVIDTAKFVFQRKLAEDDSLDNEVTLTFKSACPDIYDAMKRSISVNPSGTIKLNNYPGTIVTEEGVICGYIRCMNDRDQREMRTFPKLVNGEVVLDQVHTQNFGYAYNLVTSQWVIKPGFTVESLSLPITGPHMSGYDKINIHGVEIYGPAPSSNTVAINYGTSIKTYSTADLTLNGAPTYPGNFFCFDKFGTCAVGDGYAYKIIPSACAHTKLPNKVTKTSADTMKIQYDYYIQIPYMVTDDDNYIPPLT